MTKTWALAIGVPVWSWTYPSIRPGEATGAAAAIRNARTDRNRALAVRRCWRRDIGDSRVGVGSLELGGEMAPYWRLAQASGRCANGGFLGIAGTASQRASG